jgi:hypothetical protein
VGRTLGVGLDLGVGVTVGLGVTEDVAARVGVMMQRRGVSDPGYSNRILRLDLVGPKKLPGSHCIDRDRYGEKRDLADGYFCWAVACQQKKYPRKKNHGVPIRKLPASGVSVTPEDER